MYLIKNYRKIYDTIDLIGNDYESVLLGESTHGTSEYYNIRVNITKKLINYGFNCIFFEMEWSNGCILNQFIHSKSKNLKKILKTTFKKYPSWMWCNNKIYNFLLYLKKWNLENESKAYIYGVDCQDINLAKKNLCEDDNINCKIVKSIIFNYDKMSNSNNYWDIRDSMWLNIIKKIKKEYRYNKFILWAHNSHIGDICGNVNPNNKLNIGHLIRHSFKNSFHIGFLTGSGTVTASIKWGSDNKKFRLKKIKKNSYENLFNNYCIKNNIKSLIYVSKKNKFLCKKFNCLQLSKLNKTYKVRYIGVIYNKNNEDMSHYLYTDLDKEYDLVIFIKKTTSLKYLK